MNIVSLGTGSEGPSHLSGTSMAAAHVSGVMASILSTTTAFDLKPDAMRLYLETT